MIYHNNKRLEDLRCAIDETLTSYLMALGFNTNDLTDLDYSDFDLVATK